MNNNILELTSIKTFCYQDVKVWILIFLWRIMIFLRVETTNLHDLIVFLVLNNIFG